MISLILLIIAIILAAVGLVFIKPSDNINSDNINRDNINSDNINRDTKVAVIFITLAIVTAVIAVILAMFSSDAPLP